MSFGYSYGTGAGDGLNTYNPRTHSKVAEKEGFHMGGCSDEPRTLYVGNLDESVTEEFVSTLFNQVGTVTKTKIIFDGTNDPYAFVEFADHDQATQALQTMNRRMLLNKEMKVNWAVEPGQQATKVDTTKHFHVFVGDLSSEVDNKVLKDAFISYGEVSDAKVIRDPTTLKSKGYGFVSYPKREEAERAIEQMNGQWLGRRTIRTNWATRKPGDNQPMPGQNEKSYEEVYNQTSADNTSVYVGNISGTATEDDIRLAFSDFGRILEVRIFKVQGYAFVKFDSKENATKAIVQMNGQEVCGNCIRCSWGKTNDTSKPTAAAAGGYGYGFAGQPQNAMGAYGSGYQGAGYGGAAAPAGGAAGGATANNAQQQYWQYYAQYYNNPQLMHQWNSYWQQQQQNGGGQGGASH